MTAEPLRMRYRSQVDGKPITQALAIKLSKIVNILTAILRRRAGFTYTMQCLLGYARAFEEENGRFSVYVLIMNILEHMIPSSVLAANPGATYIRSIILDKMMIRHQGVFSILVRLGIDARAVKTFCTMHLDEQSHNRSSKPNILFSIWAADTFVKTDHNTAPLHDSFPHRRAKALLDELHLHYLQQDKEKLSIFALFVDTKIPRTKTIFHSIITLFMSTMHLFIYDANDRSKKWKIKAEMRGKCFLMKVERHCSPVQSSSSNQGVLGKTDLKDTPPKRGLRNKEETGSDQEVGIIDIDDEKVASYPKKRHKTER